LGGRSAAEEILKKKKGEKEREKARPAGSLLGGFGKTRLAHLSVRTDCPRSQSERKGKKENRKYGGKGREGGKRTAAAEKSPTLTRLRSNKTLPASWTTTAPGKKERKKRDVVAGAPPNTQPLCE